jgi:hypothetical protein
MDAEIQSFKESIQVLRHRNEFAPASSLPTEVVTAIFSFLHVRVTSPAFVHCEKPDQPDRLAWLRVTHVCHQWREIALNHPLLWSHVDFTTFSPAGAAEILARAKMVPLYLEARVPGGHWDNSRFNAFREEVQGRVSHICHLTISAEALHLDRTLKGLVSPAPTLECLSLLSHKESRNRITATVCIPNTLFDGTTPRLSCLELWTCNISWQSPLLRGLKHLDIRTPSVRPSPSVWLDALDKMQQLKTLSLHWACPTAPRGASLSSDVERTVTLPSLTLFEISSPARDCGFALAHLILPALTSLCLVPKPCCRDGSDVREILPYVARHAHGPQDTQPLQSMLFLNDIMCLEILVWTLPDIDVELPNLSDFLDTMRSARVALAIMNDGWSTGTEMGIFDAVMAALPLDNLVTLTAQNHTRTVNKEFWLRRVPRWPLLQRMRLSPHAVRGFREMLLEDNVGCESPLLPYLKKLILINTALSPPRAARLCDALMKRVEQEVPLETLDLRTCLSGSRAIELLREIVVDVLGPEETLETGAQMISASIARGLFLEDSSLAEDCDEDELDTGSDGSDMLREMWELEHGNHGSDSEDEADYW